jgi:hypothetical protein
MAREDKWKCYMQRVTRHSSVVKATQNIRVDKAGAPEGSALALEARGLSRLLGLEFEMGGW